MFVISLSLLLWEVNSNDVLKSELEILCRRSRLKASVRYNFFFPFITLYISMPRNFH